MSPYFPELLKVVCIHCGRMMHAMMVTAMDVWQVSASASCVFVMEPMALGVA